MKKILTLILLVLIFASPVTPVPETLNLQGKLTDSDGTALTGSHDITVRIYGNVTGVVSDSLWEENHTVSLTDGIYDLSLGETTSLSSLAFEDQYYLALKVDSDSEMTPKMNMSTAPYAFNAKTAQNISCIGCINSTHVVTHTKRKLIETVTLDTTLGPNSTFIGLSPTIRFASDLNENIYFNFAIPDDWENETNISLRMNYAPANTVANTNTVNFTMDYRIVAIGESITTGGNTGTTSIAMDPPNSANELAFNSSLIIPSSDLGAKKELIIVNFTRSSDDASDDFASTLDILSLEVEYQAKNFGE